MITPLEPVRTAEHTGVVSAPGGAMEGNEEVHANMTRVADRMSLWLGKPIITNAGIPSLFSKVQFVGCSPLVSFSVCIPELYNSIFTYVCQFISVYRILSSRFIRRSFQPVTFWKKQTFHRQ